MDIISREEAKEQGLKTFFTGEPCSKGHLSPRWVSSRGCIECVKLFRHEHPGRVKESEQKYKQNNQDKVRSIQRTYRTNNQRKVKQWRREQYQKDKDWYQKYYQTNKELIQKRNRLYRAANKHKMVYWASQRRARILKAIPAWADETSIKRIYEQAYLLTTKGPNTFHVDHIVPIAHELVCGLHCELNLQVLTKEENLKKSNSVWPDMP